MNLSVNLYLTNKCNLECAHCCHECTTQLDHMPPERLTWIYDWLGFVKGAGHNIIVLGITGGEPMLHPQFYNTVYILARMLKFLQPQRFELHTNGTIPFDFDLWPTLLGVFSTIFVTTDHFHQKFAKFKDLKLESLSMATFADLVIRHTWSIRNLGRAKQYIKDQEAKGVEFVPEYRCAFDNKSRTVNINFCPDEIRFCWDNSREREQNSDNYVDYDDEFLDYPDKLPELAEDYKVNHSGANCKTKCQVYKINKLTLLGRKPKDEKEN